MQTKQRKPLVSRRAILEKSKNEGLEKILSKIKEGDIVEGKCKAILLGALY